MKVAEGNVDDSPFARTIFSLAANRFTGDLVLTKSRKEYRSSWENGQVVAAVSPSPADSPGRVALSNGLVNSTSLGIIVEKLQAEPNRDPIEIVAEIANLNPQQAITLKYRVLARTAARIFALPGADFVVDNARTMRADPNIPPLDVRWLIYFGLRTHYSLSRLKKELAAVGERGVSLPQQSLQMLPAFGFTEVETPILQRMQTQELSITNLIAATPEVDAATVTCVVYALMASGYLAYGHPQTPKTPPPPDKPKQPKRQPRPQTAAGKRRPSTAASAAASPGTVQGTGFVQPKAPSSADAVATQQLIEERLKLLAADAGHFKLLGLKDTAAPAEIRSGYFDLARKLHPDHLQAIGVTGIDEKVQELFAAINKAFAVLGNPKELHRYREVMAAGGEKAYRARQKEADDMAMKILRAEEHYAMGEMALRRDHFSQAAKEFQQASELSPGEAEYQALYAWAFICSASSRDEAAPKAMQLMSSAVLKGAKNNTVLLYHAKLLKLIGRDDEATVAFRKVLRADPENREAQLELRLLQGG
jgi:cytochrome c-type biogenesis protein CcmH/NrfG